MSQHVGTNLMQIVGQAAQRGDPNAQRLLVAAGYRPGTLYGPIHQSNRVGPQAVMAPPLPGQAITAAAAHHYRHHVGQAGSSGSQGPMEVPMVGNGPREFPMGFGITPVALGANVIINAQPQVNFRPSRLVVPDSIAPSFMINDFKIGMRSQLVAPGSLPAQSFTQKAVGTAMALDTVNVGQFVTLDVTNIAYQPVNFAASLFGTTLNS
jgi:hypothetical protein